MRSLDRVERSAIDAPPLRRGALRKRDADIRAPSRASCRQVLFVHVFNFVLVCFSPLFMKINYLESSCSHE